MDKLITTVPGRMTALRAFIEMDSAGLSAVGITDEAGALVATVTVRDFCDALAAQRIDGAPSLALLALPVLVWVTLLRGCRLPRIISCLPTDTLGDVLRIMTGSGIHHVFVTAGAAALPCGVITPSDVIRLFQVDRTGAHPAPPAPEVTGAPA